MNITIRLSALTTLSVLFVVAVFGAGFAYGQSSVLISKSLPEAQLQVSQPSPTCPTFK